MIFLRIVMKIEKAIAILNESAGNFNSRINKWIHKDIGTDSLEIIRRYQLYM